MDKIDIPSVPAEETPNAGVTDTGSEGQQPTDVVVDIDKSDDVAQLRGYAKGLDKDLKTYKPIYEKVTSLFGDDRSLELAHSVFSGFAGEKFDPDNFYKTLEQLSPQRSKQLFEKFAQSQASELAQKEVEKILGGKASPEEVKLFKQWKENGYGLGDGEDIPEALKFNADGTPKSDEEITFLRNLHNQIRESRTEKLTEKQLQEQKEAEEREAKVVEDINTFSNERLSILQPELEPLGLKELPADTAEQRQEKQFLTQFIMDGVAAAFMKSKYANEYSSALQHIRDGEYLLARPYEARIEKGLIEIMRSKSLGRLLASLTTPVQEPEVRPEISSSGASPADDKTPQGRVTGDDIFKSLVAEGKIKI